MNKIKYALIGPSFFSYSEAILNEFKNRKFACYFYDERHSNTNIVKIIYRLRLSFLFYKKRDSHLNSILKKIIINKVTDIFLISPEVININFIKKLQSNGCRIHLYMWDSLKNKKNAIKIVQYLKRGSSFDPVDVNQFNLKYIPLFAEDIFKKKTGFLNRKKQIVFCGTLHSKRPSNLYELCKVLKKTSYFPILLLYYYSKFIYIIKTNFKINNYVFLKYLSTKHISKNIISAIFQNSRVVIDLHHHDQTGLTSRTFESLRSGCYLISFNQNILTLPKELRDRIILINNINEISDDYIIHKLDTPLPPISKKGDYFLSIQRFVDQLLNFSKNF